MRSGDWNPSFGGARGGPAQTAPKRLKPSPSLIRDRMDPPSPGGASALGRVLRSGAGLPHWGASSEPGRVFRIGAGPPSPGGSSALSRVLRSGADGAMCDGTDDGRLSLNFRRQDFGHNFVGVQRFQLVGYIGRQFLVGSQVVYSASKRDFPVGEVPERGAPAGRVVPQHR